MKGSGHIGFVSKASNRGICSSEKVMSAKNFKGQGAKASSTKTSIAGGFIASRKKGSVKGSHVA